MKRDEPELRSQLKQQSHRTAELRLKPRKLAIPREGDGSTAAFALADVAFESEGDVKMFMRTTGQACFAHARSATKRWAGENEMGARRTFDGSGGTVEFVFVSHAEVGGQLVILMPSPASAADEPVGMNGLEVDDLIRGE